MNENISPLFLNQARKYEVELNIFHRIKEIYKEYLSSIKINYKNKDLERIAQNLNLKEFISLVTESFFTENKEFSFVIWDGRVKSLKNLEEELFFHKNIKSRLLSFFIFKIFSYKNIFKSKINIENIHYTRKIIVKNSLIELSKILKKACENYERAILSASFVQDYTNHTIVHLGAGELANDQNFNSSILNLMQNSSKKTKLKESLNSLRSTLIGHNYGLSILGTSDRVEKLNNVFDLNSYNVLKTDLLAKSGIPENILFGTNVENMNDSIIKNFYNKINNIFSLYISPILGDIFKKMGFIDRDLFEFEPLIFEDFSYKNKKLEVLAKSLNLLKEVEGSSKEELQEKIIKEINKLL